MRRARAVFAGVGLAAVATGGAGAARPDAAPDPPADRLGAFERQLDAGFVEPVSAAVGAGGVLAIADPGAGVVRVMRRDGELLFEISEGLAQPMGVAIGPDGRIVVADAGVDRVMVFDVGGRPAGSIDVPAPGLIRPRGVVTDGPRTAVADAGRRRVIVLEGDAGIRILGGEDGGALVLPTDAALGADGEVFVCDAGADRIVRYGPDGASTSWGGFGGFPGLMSHPSGAAWAGGRLYVADARNHRVQVFTPGGAYLYEWGLHVVRPREGEGRLHYPSDVAVSADGAFGVVVEPIERRVQLFGLAAPDDGPVSTPYFERSDARHFGGRAAVAGELLVTTEPDDGRVVVWSMLRATPIELTRIGRRGEAIGAFREPGDVAIDLAARRVWVADPLSRRLQVFELDWAPGDRPGYDPFMATLATAYDLNVIPAARGWGVDRVEPTAVELLSDGTVLIADALNGRVWRVNRRFEIDEGWGQAPGDDPAFERPIDLSFDAAAGLVRVLDARLGVRTVTLDGRQISGFEPPGDVRTPASIAVGPGGEMFVSDRAGDRILVFDPRGPMVRSLGRPGLGPAGLRGPEGLAFTEDGRLLVVDRGNHRIQLLGPDGRFDDAFGSRLYVAPAKPPGGRSP